MSNQLVRNRPPLPPRQQQAWRWWPGPNTGSVWLDAAIMMAQQLTPVIADRLVSGRESRERVAADESRASMMTELRRVVGRRK